MSDWMPDLKGSPRQVDWAVKIRVTELKRWKGTLKPDDYYTVLRVHDATWWIANRGASMPKMPTEQQVDRRIVNASNPAATLTSHDGDADDEQPELPDISDQRPEAAKQLSAFVSDVGSENLLLKTATLAMACYATGQAAIRRDAEANLFRCEAAIENIRTILKNAP